MRGSQVEPHRIRSPRLVADLRLALFYRCCRMIHLETSYPSKLSSLRKVDFSYLASSQTSLNIKSVFSPLIFLLRMLIQLGCDVGERSTARLVIRDFRPEIDETISTNRLGFKHSD